MYVSCAGEFWFVTLGFADAPQSWQREQGPQRTHLEQDPGHAGTGAAREIQKGSAPRQAGLRLTLEVQGNVTSVQFIGDLVNRIIQMLRRLESPYFVLVTAKQLCKIATDARNKLAGDAEVLTRILRSKGVQYHL
jgi:hypothetical protein